MSDDFILGMGSLIFLIIFGYIIFDFIRDKPMIKKEKCTCGQEEKWCKSYLYSGGSVLLGRKNMFMCGKFKKHIIELSEHPVMKRIKKEIKEKGHSCPENW